MHKDFVGNYLNVGDKVVYCTPVSGLRQGTVVSMTPKMVRMSDGKLVWPCNIIIPGRMPA